MNNFKSYFLFIFTLICVILKVNFIFANTSNISVSDSYRTLKECEDAVIKYNLQYSNYTRSECYKNWNFYFYNLCSGNLGSCPSWREEDRDSNRDDKDWEEDDWNKNKYLSIEKYIPKLDKLLKNIEKKLIKDYWNNSWIFKRAVDILIKRFDDLWKEYWNNKDILLIVDYLKDWVNDIYKRYLETTDKDNFFCELFWNCEGKDNELETTDKDNFFCELF